MSLIRVEYINGIIKEIREKELLEIIKINKEEESFIKLRTKYFDLYANAFIWRKSVKFPYYPHHYNGYIVPKNNIINVDLYSEEIENETHYGWSGVYLDGIGFDCQHSSDIVCNSSFWGKNIFIDDDNDTFKSKEYVFWKLKNVLVKVMDTIEYKKMLAVSTIQKAWRKCRYDPEYKMCEKVLINNMLALGVKEEDLF